MRISLINTCLSISLFLFLWGCDSFSEAEQIDPWKFVPKKSFAVWEVHRLTMVDSLASITGHSGMVRLLSSSTGRKERPTYLQSLVFVGGKIETLIMFPAHHVKRDSLQKIFTKKRLYEGTEIVESAKLGTVAFSFFGDVGLVASSSLLIEDAIRQKKDKVSSFKEDNNRLFAMPGLKNDGGNLYVDWAGFSKLLTTSALSKNSSTLISQLCGSAIFDFRFAKPNVLLSGFGTDSSRSHNSMLSPFSKQTPVALQLLSVVPDRFEFLLHVGVSNVGDWYEAQLAIAGADSFRESFLQKIRSIYAFDDRAFIKTIDGELILVFREKNEILLTRVKEVTKATRALAGVSKLLAKSGKHRSEVFSDFTIHSLELPDFGAALFAPLMGRSARFCYVFMNDVLIVSEDEASIKHVIEEYDQDNTVGKSLAWQKFLSNTQRESNVTLLLDGRNYFSESDSLLRGWQQVDKMSVQFTKLDQNFYASSFLSFLERGDRKKAEVSSVEPSGAIITSPVFPVLNHQSELYESLYQDAENNLRLAGLNGKISWTRKLDGKIIDRVYEVDMLKNDKIQYLITTSTKLYIIDRLGRDVEGYPINLKITDASYVTLVDYNSTKDYRFLVANKNGDVFIYDKAGKSLPGWSPNVTGITLDDGPGYFRLKGKDYFALLSDNGIVKLFNRKADEIRGFPLKTGITPSGDLMADERNLYLVSRDGHYLSLSTSGKVENDEVLLKRSNEATFGLCSNQDKTEYIIYRLDKGQLGIIGKNAELLFEMVNPASENTTIQYHTLKKDKEVIVVFDKEQQLFFVTDKKGRQLLAQPMECTAQPGVSYNRKTDQVVIHYAVGNALRFLTLNP